MSKADDIFLIGPMGAGKTTIGRQLATMLKRRFVDADHVIESRTGVSIPTILTRARRKGGGKLIVHYASLDHLDQLLKKLS